MDFLKYNPLQKNRQDNASTHDPWMSSTPVILLIEYLRKHQNQGVILYERFGKVGLKFKPGIKGDDIKNGRAQIAMNMFGLLQDATEDLKAMIAAGIDIPLLIHYQIDPHLTTRQPIGERRSENFGAGPVAEPSRCGNSNPDKSLLWEK